MDPFNEASSISIRYTCKPQTDTQERGSNLLAEIHEELPSLEALRCGKPFRVIRVFNRPVFQPAEEIRPGDALAIKLARHAHAWAWQWWLSLYGTGTCWHLISLEERLNLVQPAGFSWLDGAEVCQMLHVTKRTLAEYRSRGMLPYSKLGGRVFYGVTR